MNMTLQKKKWKDGSCWECIWRKGNNFFLVEKKAVTKLTSASVLWEPFQDPW